MKLHASLFPFKFNSMGGKKKNVMFLFRLHFYSLWFTAIHIFVILARRKKRKIVYAPMPIYEKKTHFEFFFL